MADLSTFALVAQHRGFCQAARASGQSASALSEAIRRLEDQLGIRLLLRTTRSVTPTDAGALLLTRLRPALNEVASALDVLNDLRVSPRGMLRLNVPVSAARLFLQPMVNQFLSAYPDIVLEVIVDNNFIDLAADACDAGIRYGERLAPDMIALPIGPRSQRFAVAGAARRARAPTRPVVARLPARQVSQRRGISMGIRTRRPKAQRGAQRPADGHPPPRPTWRSAPPWRAMA